MNSSNYFKVPGLVGGNAFNKANIAAVVCTLKPVTAYHQLQIYDGATNTRIFDNQILSTDVPNVISQLPTFKQGGTNASGDVTLVNPAFIRNGLDTPDQATVTFKYASGAGLTNFIVASSDAFYS